MARTRNIKGQYVADISKGVADSSFGFAPGQQAVPPKAISNSVGSLTPVEAYSLSAAVRTCINARNEPYNQVHIRLFDKSGRELLSGEAFDFIKAPNPGQNGNEFIRAIASFCDISDERLALIQPNKDGTKSCYALNPLSAWISSPVLCRLPELIQKWNYIWNQGAQFTYNAEDIVFSAEWNPSSPVRGSSKLYTLVNSIQASYQAERYIRAFFSNNAIPASIVNVETDNQDLVEPLKREFLSAHQGEANAFRMLFTAGAKVTVDSLEQPLNEAPFQQFIDNVKSTAASIWMVPPLHSGQFDKTRFDSTREQDDFFYGSVWLPNVEKTQRFVQMIIDKHYRYSTGDRKTLRMSKSLSEKFEKAKASSDSDIVVILDCDHIPSVSRLKLHKLEYAQKLQDTFHMTPAESALEVGLDLELNDAANLVWYNTSQKFVEHVKGDLVPITPISTATKPENDATEPVLPDEAEELESQGTDDNAPNEEQVDSVKAMFRDLKKLTLDLMDKGQKWSLNDAYTLAKKHNCYLPGVVKAIRSDFLFVKDADKDSIKKHFNKKINNKSATDKYIVKLLKVK